MWLGPPDFAPVHTIRFHCFPLCCVWLQWCRINCPPLRNCTPSLSMSTNSLPEESRGNKSNAFLSLFLSSRRLLCSWSGLSGVMAAPAFTDARTHAWASASLSPGPSLPLFKRGITANPLHGIHSGLWCAWKVWVSKNSNLFLPFIVLLEKMVHPVQMICLIIFLQ